MAVTTSGVMRESGAGELWELGLSYYMHKEVSLLKRERVMAEVQLLSQHLASMYADTQRAIWPWTRKRAEQEFRAYRDEAMKGFRKLLVD